MKLPLTLAMLFLTTPSLAAVEVTCVCTKYAKTESNSLVLATEELYTTSSWPLVQACNERLDESIRAPEITDRHFNCQGIAKEDLSVNQ